MSYLDIVKHYEECYRIYGDNNKGVDWPNEADTYKRYQVMLDVMKYSPYSQKGEMLPTLLDFGCGLGHLYKYIKDNNYRVDYAGLDISSVFVEASKKKYPEIDFFNIDILSEGDEELKKYDYIVMNGVFTEKQQLSYQDMFLYLKKMLIAAFEKCNIGIAFNVMSKDVDWEREDLFHLPLNELSHFLTKELTRDFIIRNDYGLYEYSVYIYKRPSI